jgi:hypothetical protein
VRGPLGVALTAALAAILLLTPPGCADMVDDLLFELQFIPLDGAPAPAFTLTDLGGRPVSLAAQQGKVVLLYFWTTW